MTGIGGRRGQPVRERGPDGGQPLAQASRAIEAAGPAGRGHGGSKVRPRAVLREIDGVLDTLETWHLEPPPADRSAPQAFGAILGDLEAVADGPLPAPVREAPSSYHLHLALLAWQSDLLDRLLPDRRLRFPDLDSDGDEPLEPAPRSVRRRAQAQAAELAGRARG
ncbi:MAG TPA: hypothetical protein VNN74_00425 [Candidatus Micrarchaeia archaeon]|nr:hypothetical protein [Candidatus Micrarchaeia archaeon]